MPLFLSLATALSISAAAFFSGINYRHDSNVEAQVQSQTSTQSNIEADHANDNASGEIKTVSTNHAKVDVNKNSDEKFDLSAIGTLSNIFGDDDEDMEASSSNSGSAYVSNDDGYENESEDASIDVEGGASSDHLNAAGNIRSKIDF